MPIVPPPVTEYSSTVIVLMWVRTVPFCVNVMAVRLAASVALAIFHHPPVKEELPELENGAPENAVHEAPPELLSEIVRVVGTPAAEASPPTTSKSPDDGLEIVPTTVVPEVFSLLTFWTLTQLVATTHCPASCGVNLSISSPLTEQRG